MRRGTALVSFCHSMQISLLEFQEGSLVIRPLLADSMGNGLIPTSSLSFT